MIHPDDDVALRITRRADGKRLAAFAQNHERAGRVIADADDVLRCHAGLRHRLSDALTDGAPDVGARLVDDAARLAPQGDVALAGAKHRAARVEKPGAGAACTDINTQKILRHASLPEK